MLNLLTSISVSGFYTFLGVFLAFGVGLMLGWVLWPHIISLGTLLLYGTIYGTAVIAGLLVGDTPWRYERYIEYQAAVSLGLFLALLGAVLVYELAYLIWHFMSLKCEQLTGMTLGIVLLGVVICVPMMAPQVIMTMLSGAQHRLRTLFARS